MTHSALLTPPRGVKAGAWSAEDGLVTGVRCPQCAAHVAVGADWCGQCYTSMVKAPVKPPAPPLVALPALHVVNGAIAVLADIPPPPPAPPGSIPPPPLAPPAAGAGTLLPANQLWPCVHCDAVNEYERDVCKGCGRGFLDALAEPLAELPLVGAIDGSTWAGRLKVGLISLALLVAILIGFTVLGLVLK